MNVLGSLAIAFSMYSRIPMPQLSWTKERMKYTMCFFPLIGAVIGLLEFAAVKGCNALGFSCFGQIFPAVIPILVTGGIHMDGFLDVVDARASHGDKKKKLEILKDPHTGAFSIIGCSVYLILYLAAFFEMRPAVIPVYCLTFVITRALSGLSVVTFPMAKESGLAASFSGAAQKRTVVIIMVLYLAAAEWGVWYFGGFLPAVLVPSVSLLVYWYYYAIAKREFGGITGDLAGYFLQICELALVAGLAAVSHLIPS